MIAADQESLRAAPGTAYEIVSRREAAAPSRYPTFLRNLVAALFLLLMCLSIFLVRLKIAGLPVRTMLVVAVLGLIALASPALILRAVREQAFLVALLFYVMLAAIVASAMAGTSPHAMIEQVIEIHVQAMMGVVLGHCVIQLCGAQRFALLFGLPIGISALVAAFQFVGLEPAWKLYETIAAMQPQTKVDLMYYDPRYRPTGLSYSPVLLGTQTCLMFAVLFVVFALNRGARVVLSHLHARIIILVGAVCIAALVSGNRSPLLGAAVFLAAFLCRTRPALGLAMVIAGPVVLILGDVLNDMLNNSGLRALNTENSSGEGRAVLRAYGWMLFMDQPLGYGLSFNSLDHWWKYWGNLQHYENANAITQHALHNSYLMTLNKHGAMILLLIPVVLRRLSVNPIAFFAFLPYAIHVFYHNDGPLQGDFLFWYALPLFSLTALYGRQAERRAPKVADIDARRTMAMPPFPEVKPA